MKTALLTIALVIATTTMYAQSPIGKGESQFNAGVGFSTWGIPVYAGFDYGIHRDFTIGAEFSFRSYRENWKNNRYNHSVIGLLGNINYHFNSLFQLPSPWDLYAGLNLGFYMWNSVDGYPGSHASGLGIGGQVGLRYFFSNSVGVNLEFGGGNAFSGGKLGLTFKL